MHVTGTTNINTPGKPGLYAGLQQQLRALLAGESDRIANYANFAALVYHSLPDLNWAGFYLLQGEELVLGPFQGRPACVRIPLGKGVCGTAAQQRATQLVPDVFAFPGSELVVPLLAGGQLLGVFDLDSPLPARFDEADAAGVQALLTALH
jgi:L-methionine (R)-S-oxide reductase